MSQLPTIPHHRWTAVKIMIGAAARAAESLPTSERADVFEGISIAASQFPEMGPTSEPAQVAQYAASLAASLRDAESLQLHFRNLFNA